MQPEGPTRKYRHRFAQGSGTKTRTCLGLYHSQCGSAGSTKNRGFGSNSNGDSLNTTDKWSRLKSRLWLRLLREENAGTIDWLLLRVQPKHVFELGAFRLDENNPFVSAARLMLEKGESGVNGATKQLDKFFEAQSRKTITQYLDLRKSAVSKQHDLPSEHWVNPLEAALSPWDASEMTDPAIPGQFSPRRASDDAERLWNLIASISERGYQRHSGPDGDITCEGLVSREGTLRFQLIGGTHRAAVLVAMGNTEIPVRILRFVTTESADDWPKVQAGGFSLCGALERFGKFFCDRPC